MQAQVLLRRQVAVERRVLEDEPDVAADVVALGHVGDHVSAFAAGAGEDLVERFLKFVFVAAGDDDVGPGLGQGTGDRQAQALAAAGYQGSAAGQVK